MRTALLRRQTEAASSLCPLHCVCPALPASQASKRELHAGRDEVPIVEQVVLAVARVVGVRDVQLPPLTTGGGEPDGGRIAPLHESTAWTGRHPGHILRPGELRQQTLATEDLVILEPP